MRLLSLILCCILLIPAQLLADLRGPIIEVTDGDTVVMQLAGKRERIRLIGIDAPELHQNERAVKQAGWYEIGVEQVLRLGEQARDALVALCPPNTSVIVRFDVERRDRYGRLLGYLYLDDGTFVNEEILRRGYAMLFTVPPNVTHVDALRSAFRYARKSRSGLWK